MAEPISNIREYIIEKRKEGIPDSQILFSLRNSSWPDDIIDTAFQDASKVVQAVPEAEPAKEDSAVEQQAEKKPEEKPKEEPKQEKKEKKQFSIMALFAFLTSPIPFLGLGVAMSAFDDIKKNNKTGVFLAVIALLINLGIILFLIYMFYQIFTLPPDNLAGFAKVVNDMFNLV